MKPADASAKLCGFACLIVEDDSAFASLVAKVIQEEGGQAFHSPTLAAAAEVSDSRPFDLILLDNHLPDGKAYNFFHRLSRRHPNTPVVMITGLPDLTEALSLTRNGLFDYLTKPVEADDLLACIKRALQRMRAGTEGEQQQPSMGDSPEIQEVVRFLKEAARYPTATVLLTGESGAGKDLAARTLHELTFADPARVSPYVAVNCAALPAEMFEAELFGAERGAYTGADKRRPGLAGAAQNGSLLLDEIAEVPLALQAKLLRLLEEREFRSLGSTEVQRFNGRLITATNKSLHDEVRKGLFREDLLFRLEVLTIELPPLRRRKSDIPRLAEQLLQQLGKKYDRQVPHIEAESMAALQNHPFPGNVRELRNILERALLRSPEGSRWLILNPSQWSTSARPTTSSTLSTQPSPSLTAAPLPPSRADLTPLEAHEYQLIRSALQECKGGIRRAATQLGMSPQALLRRLEKWPELRQSS